METSKLEFAGLQTPSELADYEREVLALLDEEVSLYEEAISLLRELEDAIRNQSLVKLAKLIGRFQDVGQRFKVLEQKASAFERGQSESLTLANHSFEAISNQEIKIIEKAQAEVRRLEKRFGDVWVSDKLKFKIEEELKVRQN